MTTVIRARTLLGREIVPARVEFGRRIESVERFETEEAPLLPVLAPGFIDVHVHGGAGADTMDGADGVREMARFHLRHGTTALLATTITNPLERLEAALRGVAEVAEEPAADRAEVLGAHLEGPFISPGRLGAQPPHTQPCDTTVFERLAGLARIRVITLAPELPGAGDLIACAHRWGARVSLGHTMATAREAQEAFARGAAAVTHLFNGMGGIQAREPGTAGAALADPGIWIELIAEPEHLHAATIRLAAAAARTRLLLITDAVRAAGMPPGRYLLGGLPVISDGSSVRLESGSLAGSLLTMDSGLRHLVASGVPLQAALDAAAGAPARYLGLLDRGRISRGARADLVLLGADLRLEQVFLAGHPVLG